MSVNKRTDWGQGSCGWTQKKEVYRNGTPPFGVSRMSNQKAVMLLRSLPPTC